MSCELCGDTFAVPVSYHMLTTHPGCGHSSGGRGYTSNGTYKTGWSGACGEGGIAWYLLCESCRGSYMKRAKPPQPSAASGSGSARSRKTGAVVRQTVITYPAANDDDDGRDFSDSEDDGDNDRGGWKPKPLQPKQQQGQYIPIPMTHFIKSY